MNPFLFILGSHPDLSLAEIHALFSDARLIARQEDWVVMDFGSSPPSDRDFQRLGGTIKVAQWITTATPFSLAEKLAETIALVGTDRKLIYGLSLYGCPESQLKSLLMAIKKRHQQAGIKSRFINKDSRNLSVAQYTHHLERGQEYLVLKSGVDFQIGRVIFVQDIEGYSLRDYGKPVRNMRMGMLPPKLAQMMLNFSGARPGQTVWDPFCGGGTLIMEGALMGFKMIGSDISEPNLSGARANMGWFSSQIRTHDDSLLFQHDAITPLPKPFHCDAVVFEGDLGPPLGDSPQMDFFETTLERLHQLYVDFFLNLKRSVASGTIVVAALPFFFIHQRSVFFKDTIATILQSGFRPEPFKTGGTPQPFLVYRRPEQHVGRAIYRFSVA